MKTTRWSPEEKGTRTGPGSRHPLLLVSSYVITGSVGIMFNQKALDPIFTYLVALIRVDRGSTGFALAPFLGKLLRTLLALL